MKTIAPKMYEAMFLVDSSKAAADWTGIEKSITTILKRADAEVVSLKKWDERRLAYDIAGQSRGTYILCYFRADGQKIGDLERDVELSEQIMRVLVLRGDHVKPEDLDKDTPATKAQKAAEESAAAAAEKAEQEAAVAKTEAEVKPDETVAATVEDQAPAPETEVAEAATEEPEAPEVSEAAEEPVVQADSEPVIAADPEPVATEPEQADEGSVSAPEPETGEDDEKDKLPE